MIERAFIHVAGPTGAGKTAFVEVMLRGIDRWWLAARCVRNDALRRSRETPGKTHPELRRYRLAGATGAVLFEFPGKDVGSDAFFMTRAAELVGALGRLRTESALFDDILLGTHGTKIPITAVIADLTDAQDAGVKKALARVRRALRREP